MKTFNRLQIVEAFNRIEASMIKAGLDPADLSGLALDDILADLINELEGKLSPEPEETLLVPGVGFVPVLGQIGDHPEIGNKVQWGGIPHE